MLVSIRFTISPCRRQKYQNQTLFVTPEKKHKKAQETWSALFYLSLHLHGEVLEHVVQVSDAPLQLQDLVVPRLDLVQSLPRSLSVNQDLNSAVTIRISCIVNDTKICQQSRGFIYGQWWKTYSEPLRVPVQHCKNTSLQVKHFLS